MLKFLVVAYILQSSINAVWSIDRLLTLSNYSGWDPTPADITEKDVIQYYIELILEVYQQIEMVSSIEMKWHNLDNQIIKHWNIVLFSILIPPDQWI